MSSEQEDKQFIFSTLEYLNNLYENNSEIIFNREKLKQGINLLEEAFGFELLNDIHKKGYSLHSTNPSLSLPKLISVNVECPTHGSNNDLLDMDPSLATKFDQYVLKLHQTPYFKDIEKGSKQYNQRLLKAKEKFLKKYTPQTKTPVINETPVKKEVTEEDKKMAEEWKNKGNDFFKESKFEESIQFYTKAIELNETAIYFSNRAASFLHLKKYQNVVDDCKRAIELNSKYTKPYLRIASALESLGRYEEAIEYYQLLLELEPNNQIAQQSLESIKKKASTKENDFSSFLNDNGLRDLANNIQKEKESNPNQMPQSETPSFDEILSNPNIMNLAQETMKNNNFSQYLNNPQFLNMAQQMLSNPNQLNDLMKNLGNFGNFGQNNNNN